MAKATLFRNNHLCFRKTRLIPVFFLPGLLFGRRICFLVFCIFFLNIQISYSDVDNLDKKQLTPLGCEKHAIEICRHKSTSQIIGFIESQKNIVTKGSSLCVIAELMKRVGDYQATEYYEKAIQAEPSEPAYELFYADYLRNFRGPGRPLFSYAEEHYYRAKAKLLSRRGGESVDSGEMVSARLAWGLIALYQEDGLPVPGMNLNAYGLGGVQKPLVFLSSISMFGANTTDLDRVDDVRDFTSEALFASSQSRLNRPLSREELRGLIRSKLQYGSQSRLRLRWNWAPMIEFSYGRQYNRNGQITNFFQPNTFNDIGVDEFGVAVEKTLKVNNLFDLFLRGKYKRAYREGVIEFFPNDTENINQFEFRGAVSRNFGPNKLLLEGFYSYLDITPTVPDYFADRNRSYYGANITYQIFSPEVYQEFFSTRGTDLWAGVLYDKEWFGSVNLNKMNYHTGIAMKGIKIQEGRYFNSWDFSFQPTVFTGKTSGDSHLTNSQYRNNFVFLLRIKDEEAINTYKAPPSGLDFWDSLAFAHLVVPVRHDLSLNGPNYYENFRLGLGLHTKWVVNSRWLTTFLLSADYDFQRFYKLDKNLSLFKIMFSVGYDKK